MARSWADILEPSDEDPDQKYFRVPSGKDIRSLEKELQPPMPDPQVPPLREIRTAMGTSDDEARAKIQQQVRDNPLGALARLPAQAASDIGNGLTNPANITNLGAAAGMVPAWVHLINQLLFGAAAPQNPQNDLGALMKNGEK